MIDITAAVLSAFLSSPAPAVAPQSTVSPGASQTAWQQPLQLAQEAEGPTGGGGGGGSGGDSP